MPENLTETIVTKARYENSTGSRWFYGPLHLISAAGKLSWKFFEQSGYLNTEKQLVGKPHIRVGG